MNWWKIIFIETIPLSVFTYFILSSNDYFIISTIIFPISVLIILDIGQKIDLILIETILVSVITSYEWTTCCLILICPLLLETGKGWSQVDKLNLDVSLYQRALQLYSFLCRLQSYDPVTHLVSYLKSVGGKFYWMNSWNLWYWDLEILFGQRSFSPMVLSISKI